MVKRFIRRALVCRKDPAIFLVHLFLLHFMIFLVHPSFASAEVGTFKAPIKRPSHKSAKKTAAESSAQTLKKSETMPTAVFSQMQAAPDAALDFEFEIKRLNNLLKITDQNADAFFNRGWLYEYKGDLSMAEQDYSKAIQVNNRHAAAHYNRGVLFAKMKKFEQAVQDFSATLKLEPNAVDAYCNRGNANLQLGHIDLALQDYSAGLKIRPDDADLNYNRGVAYLVKGEKGEAREDFKRAAQAGHSKAKEILRGVGVK